MSFQQKSAFINVFLLLGLFIYIFEPGAALFTNGDGYQYSNSKLITAIIILVVIEIVTHVILAVYETKQNAKWAEITDERERSIEQKSYVLPYWFIALTVVGLIFAGAAMDYSSISFYCLYLIIFVADWLHYVCQCYYFKKGG